MRKHKHTILALVLGISMLTVPVMAGELNSISANSSVSAMNLLKEESVKANYNIMLYDDEWNILNEFHADGEMITYSYQGEEICEVSNTNGNTTRISTEGNVTTITNYQDNKEVSTYNITERSSTFVANKEEVTNLLKAASKGELSLSAIESDISICADTITDGYNLSTMCPSVWTVNVGYDRFARPSTAMDESDIQSFLESKNSVLANDIVVYRKNSNGTVYNTGITITPSTVIHNASTSYYINPKIILGSLQREQGLISKTSGDFSARAFYFCMGYGATDSGDINGYTGFDTQVDQGTHRYMELWNEGYELGRNGFPVSFAASDGTIQINNCGTYALFRYTPWQSSNRLFLDILDGYWPDSNGVNGINWE